MPDSASPRTSSSRGRRGLGRGLDALIPAGPDAGLRLVDVSAIEPNPGQPRQHFERDALQTLADSVKEHGVLQPLVVSETAPGKFRLIVGERRWQASRLAGLREVPVIVREVGDREMLELALIENVQRRDLNPLEEAAAYERLVQEYGLTQQQVATRVGRSRVAVANTLRLLALPQTVKSAVVDGRVSEGHARALLALPSHDMQIAALARVERESLSVRQTEELVRRIVETPSPVAAPEARDPDIAAAEAALRRALGARVTLRPRQHGGRIVIDCHTDDEFDSLYRRLLGEDG